MLRLACLLATATTLVHATAFAQVTAGPSPATATPVAPASQPVSPNEHAPLDAAAASPPETTTPIESRWYGWQVLVTGGVAGSVLATNLLLWTHDSDAAIPGTGLWLAAYILGGPIVHVAHDRPLHALASLAFNVGIPFGAIVLTLMGSMMQADCDSGFPHDEGPDCSLRSAMPYILATSLVLAPTLDALLLGREHVPTAQGGVTIGAEPLLRSGLGAGVAWGGMVSVRGTL